MKKLLTLALVIGVMGCEQTVSDRQGGTATTAYDAMNPPIVEVAGGKLRGFMDDGTYSFLGIRYATAERFKMPQKVEPWDGVKDAQSYGTTCPVPTQTRVGADEFVWPHRYWPENEDCQYLNVWTQHLDADARRPVMVFMHGGAFTNGSSIEAVAYEGKNLSAFGDVVMVTLNHRLNVLGTLNLSAYGPEYEKAGNTGMADIEAALRWVQENIEAFGGDPGSVTIFGQSGGSGKVVHLMHMPSAKGLFHKAIAESSGSAAYLTAEESARIAELILQKLRLNRTQVVRLESLPYDELLEVANESLAQVRKEVDRNISWRPCSMGTTSRLNTAHGPPRCLSLPAPTSVSARVRSLLVMAARTRGARRKPAPISRSASAAMLTRSSLSLKLYFRLRRLLTPTSMLLATGGLSRRHWRPDSTKAMVPSITTCFPTRRR